MGEKKSREVEVFWSALHDALFSPKEANDATESQAKKKPSFGVLKRALKEHLAGLEPGNRLTFVLFLLNGLHVKDVLNSRKKIPEVSLLLVAFDESFRTRGAKLMSDEANIQLVVSFISRELRDPFCGPRVLLALCATMKRFHPMWPSTGTVDPSTAFDYLRPMFEKASGYPSVAFELAATWKLHSRVAWRECIPALAKLNRWKLVEKFADACITNDRIEIQRMLVRCALETSNLNQAEQFVKKYELHSDFPLCPNTADGKNNR